MRFSTLRPQTAGVCGEEQFGAPTVPFLSMFSRIRPHAQRAFFLCTFMHNCLNDSMGTRLDALASLQGVERGSRANDFCFS